MALLIPTLLIYVAPIENGTQEIDVEAVLDADTGMVYADFGGDVVGVVTPQGHMIKIRHNFGALMKDIADADAEE